MIARGWKRSTPQPINANFRSVFRLEDLPSVGEHRCRSSCITNLIPDFVS
jgi:hypothetical protein